MKSIIGLIVGVLLGWQLYTQPVSSTSSEADVAFKTMCDAARADGIQLSGAGRRTYDQQVKLWTKYKLGEGPQAALPGTSKHEVGLAWDIRLHGYDSPEYKWLAANGTKYGFYNTVRGEPWHWERK